MSETLSAKSKERIVKWADMQSGEVATLINQGAIRETNHRQVFEQGNWQGQKLGGELKFFDAIYNRTYEPDQQRLMRVKNKSVANIIPSKKLIIRPFLGNKSNRKQVKQQTMSTFELMKPEFVQK